MGPVDRKRLDDFGIGDLFQCLADMAMLLTVFASACHLGFFFPVRIGHRLFAAVTAVESKTIDQNGD